MKVTYKNLVQLNKSEARMILINKLNQNSGNVKKTAKQFRTAPRIVRKWRDRYQKYGKNGLKDKPPIPKKYQEKQLSLEDKLLLEERQSTNYGRITLKKHMHQKWKFAFTDRHIRTVLKNAGLEKQQKKRSKNGEQRTFYNHDALMPFEALQIDTKHILDQHALPEKVYQFIRRNGLPRYQWTAIDVKTRVRFLAWSHELNATFGKLFIEMIALWLRTCGVRHAIQVQIDNGMEFCACSKRKEKEWNEYFNNKYQLSLKTIPPGAKYMQGYVERSHRFDDEYFYVPQGMKTRKIEKFLLNGFTWQTFYNTQRPHHGKYMDGLTPSQKLSSLNTLINPNITFLPPFRLENLLNYAGTGGHEVASHYLMLRI